MGRMRRRIAMVTVVGSGALIAAPAASADTITGVCAFPVGVTTVQNKVRTVATPQPDGSTLVKLTGAYKEALTNELTGQSITLNASGPGLVTVPAGFPDTNPVLAIQSFGIAATYVTNGAQFGLPNFFLYAGPFDFTTDTSNDTLVSVTRKPNVLLDICAALTP